MSEDTYVAAVDQGTTGTRFVAFDRAGRVRASAYEPHEQYYPRPGWVEHDPVELWTNTKAVVRDALADADVAPSTLAAIGVANQRETAVLWDAETGDPVHRAIVWQDRRTTARVEELEADERAAEIRATTGLRPDAYFSATKLEWLLDNAGTDGDRGGGTGGNDRSDGSDDGDDGGGDDNGGDGGDGGGGDSLRERAAAGEVLFGTVDSWLLYNLTGGDAHVTDVTNASRTMLYDIHEGDWDDDLLAEFGVPRACLPEVRPSSDAAAFGHTDPDGFLGAAVPLAGVLGDQQAALFGQACFDPGDAKNTYGTGSFVLLNTGIEAVESDHGLLTTVAFQRSGDPVQYALEGSIFVTGAALEWLVDVSLVDDVAETDRLARSVDSPDGVYVVPAFAGLGAPHWDGRARGTVLGLTRGTRREHVVRATLEAVAFRTRDVTEAMAADAGMDLGPLRVDGGAARNDFLCQVQADALETDVVRAAVEETTALGAASAAGLAVGYWDDVDEMRANRRVDRVFEPDPDSGVAARYDRWGEAVERSRDWARDDE